MARALAVRRAQGIEGIATAEAVDAAITAAGLGLREDRPYKGRIQGRFFRRTVCVRGDLWPGQRLWVKAHELSHGLEATSDGPLYDRGPGGDLDDGAAELRAQVFAWTLLVGRPARTEAGLNRQLADASAAGLPLDSLCAAMTILARGLRGPAGPSPRRRRSPAPARAA